VYDNTVGNFLAVRAVAIGILCAPCVLGQAPVALAPLEQNLKATETAWANLARELDSKLARLLPCDAAAIKTIQDVSAASQARIAALTAYLKAVADNMAADIVAARNIRDGEQGRLTSLPAERTDTEQERAGIESQLRNLADSVRAKPGLAAAEFQLKQLESMTRERATLAAKQSADGPVVVEKLNTLIGALERREAAVRQTAVAAAAENQSWEQYFAARLARTRTECTVTGGGGR